MSLYKRCDCPKWKCEHYWHYDFRVNRGRHRASTETADKHTARDFEATERTKILEGGHGIRRQPDILFREFAREYFRIHAVPNKKATTIHRETEILEGRLLPAFGDQLLRDITAFGIEQYKAKRLAAGRAPGTVNRELMFLKAILSKAVEWKRLLASPAATVRRVKGKGQRTRILTPDEQRRLLLAYDRGGRRRHVKPIIELLLITGARLGEILSLRWQDCENGYMRFVDTKSGKPRRLPMTAAMQMILADVPKHDQNVVFVSFRNGGRYTRLLTGFKAALKDAGITDQGVVIHTLRHTALSRMMDAGLDVRTIMEISGHQSLAMLERYTHPTEQRKAEALETFSALVTNRPHSESAPQKTSTKTA